MSLSMIQLTGDLIHLLAVFMLLAKIRETHSVAGISGKSQLLLAIVFITRYLDIFVIFISFYNTMLKLTLIIATVATVHSIYRRFRSTYDRNNDSFHISILIISAFNLAVLVNHGFTALEILWTFSIYLESVAIVPQLYMIYETKKWEPIIKYYLLAFGSYRIFYMIKWIMFPKIEGHYDLIAISSATMQVAIIISAVIVITAGMDGRNDNSKTYGGSLYKWIDRYTDDPKPINNLRNHVLTRAELTGYRLINNPETIEDTDKSGSRERSSDDFKEDGDCGLAPGKVDNKLDRLIV